MMKRKRPRKPRPTLADFYEQVVTVLAASSSATSRYFVCVVRPSRGKRRRVWTLVRIERGPYASPGGAGFHAEAVAAHLGLQLRLGTALGAELIDA